MVRSCEVCEGLGDSTRGEPRFVRIEGRILVLCEDHSRQCDGVHRLDDVYAMFREGSGARSGLGRRSPVARRVFPPRPEGRRMGSGRRLDD